MFTSGTSLQQVIVNSTAKLRALRDALADIQDLYQWSSAQALADLEALGLTATDAQKLQTAIADANELAVLYKGGGLGAYTLPYNFSATQAEIIGAQ